MSTLRERALFALGAIHIVGFGDEAAPHPRDSVQPTEAEILAKMAELARPTVVDVRAERDRRRYPGRLATELGFDADLRDWRDGENLHGLGSTGTALKARGGSHPMIWFRDADDITRILTPDQAMNLGLRYGTYVTLVAQAKIAVEAKMNAGTITTLVGIRDAPDWPDPMVVPAP